MRSLSSRLGPLYGSPVTTVVNRLLKSRPRDLIAMHAGEPNVPPPPELEEELGKLIKEFGQRAWAYAPALGLPELREAIAEDLRGLGASVDPSLVAVTPSSSAAIYSALSVLLDPGDELILTDPTFMMYRPIAESLGARVVWLPEDMEDGFRPDPEAFKELVTPRTKAIVIVNPDNPTGRLVGGEALRAIVEYAQDKGVYVIVDEAYRTLVYDGSYDFAWRYSQEAVIGVNTFSKDPGVPGLRVGYVYGPEEFIRAYESFSAHAFFGASNLSQLAALAYLRWRGKEGFRSYLVSLYRERRDAAVRALRKYVPWARFYEPPAGMYVLADVGARDSDQLAAQLIERARVSVMPGSAFSERYRGSIRVTFTTNEPSVIEEGIRRIGETLKGIA